MTTDIPATMRAMEAQTMSLKDLRLVEKPVPEPAPGEVLLRVRAVSLNFRDVAVLTQNYYPDLKAPFVPCSDACGEIVALGDGVTGWRIGDRVTPAYTRGWHGGLPTPEMRSEGTLGGPLDGVLAEYVVATAADIVAVPPALTDEQASTLPIAGLTAWSALSLGGLRPDKTVLVQGTGGVSTFAIQFAKAAGATVVVTSSSDAKLARAAELGADLGVNYRTSDDWAAEVKRLTGGHGADIVVETGGATLAESLNAAAWGGFVGVVGFVAGYSAEIGIRQLLAPMLRLQGVAVGSREAFRRMNRAIEAHGVTPVVADSRPLSDAAAAFEALAAGEGGFGKQVVTL